MRNVVWSVRALDDLALGFDYIAEDSENNADLVADRIDAAARLLGHMPAGRPGRIHGMYEKAVRRTPYIIAYTLSDRTVTILRIIHGALDWPECEWPAE